MDPKQLIEKVLKGADPTRVLEAGSGSLMTPLDNTVWMPSGRDWVGAKISEKLARALLSIKTLGLVRVGSNAETYADAANEADQTIELHPSAGSKLWFLKVKSSVKPRVSAVLARLRTR